MTCIMVGETGLCNRVHRDSTFDFKKNTVNGFKEKKQMQRFTIPLAATNRRLIKANILRGLLVH